jgi:hypothetical protein
MVWLANRMYWVHPETLDVEDLGLATAGTIYGVGQHQITEFWNVDNPLISRASHIHPEARPATARRSAPDTELRGAAAPSPKAAPSPEAAPSPKAAQPPPKEAPPAAKAAPPPKAPPTPTSPPAAKASEPVNRPAAKILAQESEEVLL